MSTGSLGIITFRKKKALNVDFKISVNHQEMNNQIMFFVWVDQILRHRHRSPYTMTGQNLSQLLLGLGDI